MEPEDQITSERGCGQRKKGGVYLTVAEGPGGKPIEHFLIDPPIPVDLQQLGIGPRGVHLVQRGNIWHVFDVVGTKHYPNVADFVEEARLLGISRRAELPDYSVLTPESKLVLIHQRAFINNWQELFRQLSREEGQTFRCVSPYPEIADRHERHKEMCAGLWWHDVEGMRDEEGSGCRIYGMRDLPCGHSYAGYRADCNFFPEYKYAIFGSFPLGGIEVVEDPDDRTHVPKETRARQSRLPVTVVES